MSGKEKMKASLRQESARRIGEPSLASKAISVGLTQRANSYESSYNIAMHIAYKMLRLQQEELQTGRMQRPMQGPLDHVCQDSSFVAYDAPDGRVAVDATRLRAKYLCQRR